MHASTHNRYRCRLRFFFSYPLPLPPVSLVLSRRQPSQAGSNNDKGSSSRPRWANRTGHLNVRSQLIQRGRWDSAYAEHRDSIRFDSPLGFSVVSVAQAPVYMKQVFFLFLFAFYSVFCTLFSFLTVLGLLSRALSPSLVFFFNVYSTAGQSYARLPWLRYPIVQTQTKAEYRPRIKLGGCRGQNS